jgi:hypothetical protein
LVLLALAFSSNSAQKKTVKKVQVTAQTVATLAEGGAYTIDLTQRGIVYVIDADVDHSRLRVRTSKAVVPINEMLRGSGRNGKLVMGYGSDIRFEELEMETARAGWSFSCGETTCHCRTLDDCDRLGDSGKCKGSWTCDKTGCTCNKAP